KSCSTSAPPCAVAGQTIISSDNKIPGVYRQTAYAEIAWKHAATGFSTAIEARANSKVYVDDTNQNTAPGFAVLNWHGGFSQNLNNWRLAEFVRIENILDRDYVGSVRINDANKQFYESGANRNWLLGLKASYEF
ncbi:MAG: TonB-dependent receptor, partial [Pseudomonadota bacterium]